MQSLDSAAMGERVRQKREQLKISREQLAESLNVSTKFISDIENGKRGVSLKNLIKLSETLSLSTDYMLFGNPADPASSEIFMLTVNKCPPPKREHLLTIINYIIESYQE